MAESHYTRAGNGAARPRELTTVIAEILDAGQSSKFEYEGACRHGLRAGLCLRGRSWSQADFEAAEIVAVAINLLGVKRPTWAQGQLAYTEDGFSPIERTRRIRCGNRIPTDRFNHGGRPVLYCSRLCSGAHYANRARTFGLKVSRVEYLARCAIQSKRTMEERARPCKHCGRMFWTLINQKHCSRRCYNIGRSAERPCARCGKVFRRNSTSHKHCSPTCAAASRRITINRECPVCGTIFRPKRPSDPKRVCSCRCAALARQKKGEALQQLGFDFGPSVNPNPARPTPTCQTVRWMRTPRRRSFLKPPNDQRMLI
jgi:hypothetical protein